MAMFPWSNKPDPKPQQQLGPAAASPTVPRMSLACSGCGSPFCNGRCMQNVAYAHPAQQSPSISALIDAQNRMQLQMMQAVGIQQPKPRPLIPEEELICATGGIVAWRSWRLQGFGKQLFSFNAQVWPIRAPLEAICKRDAMECLGNYCACGIYGWKERKNLKVNQSEYSCLDGEVWFWGRVIEHELGYRAEFAYPKAFVNSGGLAKKLAAIYGAKLIER